jgi:hypothetical protein
VFAHLSMAVPRIAIQQLLFSQQRSNNRLFFGL